MGIFSKIMGTHSERELKRVYPIVDKIEAMGPAMEKLSDEELRAKTDEFKKRLSEGETLDDLLVEAYAVVREAATPREIAIGTPMNKLRNSIPNKIPAMPMISSPPSLQYCRGI